MFHSECLLQTECGCSGLRTGITKAVVHPPTEDGEIDSDVDAAAVGKHRNSGRLQTSWRGIGTSENAARYHQHIGKVHLLYDGAEISGKTNNTYASTTFKLVDVNTANISK